MQRSKIKKEETVCSEDSVDGEMNLKQTIANLPLIETFEERFCFLVLSVL